MSGTTATAKIPVHVSNGNALVWSVQGAPCPLCVASGLSYLALLDASVLRSQHRICGTLAGTLPQAGQQNLFLGMPLLLLPEEVVLLLEQGMKAPIKWCHMHLTWSTELAYLVDDSGSHVSPTPQQLSTWNDTRKARLNAPNRVDTPTKATPPPLSDAALQKRLERQKRKEAQMAALKAAQEAQDAQDAQDAHALMAPDSELREAPNAQETASYAFRIPATSEEFSWYEGKTYHTLQEVRDAGLWSYPSNQEERAKCAVFADLWRKGYYMGNGLRFGGDWLVYPGMCFVSAGGNYSSSPKATRSATILTLWPPSIRLPTLQYNRWRSLHMDALALRRKNPISFAVGTNLQTK